MGPAVSVILDATVVRLVLVPSAMFLMGGANGWLPRALDRILPHPRLHADVAPEPRPAPVSASSSAPAG
ncbi:hypothetical protein [Streptomyces sp. NPDC093093]|uniref:hypothetical protein n=1 Tax=Streptomyces sp. NPDC093093 TaxID=3366025 RepID=UPI0038229859